MTKLYEIADEYRRVFAAIEANGGELTPELEAELDSVGGSFEGKIDACCAAVKELESDERAYRHEADRLARRARVAANAVKRLEKYVMAGIQLVGETSVKTPRFTARIQKNPPSAFWTGDPDKIPREWLSVTVTEKFASNRALNTKKIGGELPPEIEIRQGEHLRIV